MIPPSGLKRVAKVYEKGAENKGENNWTLGIPFSSLISSAIRHLNDWRWEELAKTPHEEDHLAQAVWNILAIMHFEDTGRRELNNLWEVGESR